jgi:predicted transcriptional regulator
LTLLHSSRTLKEMETKFALKKFGTQLWTREKARPIRSHLVDALEHLRTGDVLAIDASGVDVFDFSFAAELFGKTLSRLGVDYPGRFVIAEGLTETARENLTQALEASNLVMIERIGDALQLIGKVHPFDRETFTGILGAGEAVSAAALGKKLDVTPTAMNERLSKLSNLGVIRREKSSSASGREQYIYKVMG